MNQLGTFFEGFFHVMEEMNAVTATRPGIRVLTRGLNEREPKQKHWRNSRQEKAVLSWTSRP